MLTKSAMDELIDSKHPAYRYDAAFGEFKSSRGLSTVVLVIFNAFKCIVFFKYSFELIFSDQIVLSRLVEGCDPAYLSADGMKVLIKAMKLLDDAKDSYDIELIAAATGHVASLLRLKSSGVAKE